MYCMIDKWSNRKLLNPALVLHAVRLSLKFNCCTTLYDLVTPQIFIDIGQKRTVNVRAFDQYFIYN